MRFAAATLALAGAVAAHNKGSVVYSTDYVTITSCGPEVTNCPAKSTVTSSSVVTLQTSTIYTTTVKTVTSCAATVTNCPAHSTVVVTETIPVSTTVCPVTETETASVSKTYPAHNGTVTATTTPGSGPKSSAVTLVTSKPASVCVPSQSVKTIVSSITTVVPTTIYETVNVDCPTKSTPSAGPSPSANSTSSGPKPSGSQVVTAGAASLAGSAVFAVVAGAVALML